MKIRSFINAEYRESVPDTENDTSPGPAVPTPEQMAVIDPDSAAPDTGQDVIPDEDASLWDQLSKEIDEPDDDDLTEDSPVEPLVEPEPEETTPEAPAETEEEPAPETPAEEEPTAADTALPADPEVQPTEEPEPEPIPQQTAEEIAEAHTVRRTGIETTLTDRFSLTDAEALQLVTNPGEVFPKLQARMFTDMWLHVEQLIDQRLPTVIESTTRSMKVRDEKVNDFFEAWPKLDRKKHGTQVAQVAKVFSEVNPNATEAQVTQGVGMQVMMMNGIMPDDVIDTPPEETSAETPAAPRKPAAVHGANRAPKQSSGNIYEDLSYDLDEDED